MLFCTRAWNVKQWLSHSSGAEQAEIDSLMHCRTCLQHRKTFKKKKSELTAPTLKLPPTMKGLVRDASTIASAPCHTLDGTNCTEKGMGTDTLRYLYHTLLCGIIPVHTAVYYIQHARVPNKRTWCPCEKKEVERTKTRGSWSYSWDTSPVRFTSQKPCIQYAIHTEGSIRAPSKAHKLGLY